MIVTIWNAVVSLMARLGWKLDPTEADSLVDRHYTITLTGNVRNDKSSSFSRVRVLREIRIRLQFRERKDTFFDKIIAEEVEKVSTTLRETLLYESDTVITRAGGKIAEVVFSATDEMS